jgi:hypothetical protein
MILGLGAAAIYVMNNKDTLFPPANATDGGTAPATTDPGTTTPAATETPAAAPATDPAPASPPTTATTPVVINNYGNDPNRRKRCRDKYGNCWTGGFDKYGYCVVKHGCDWKNLKPYLPGITPSPVKPGSPAEGDQLTYICQNEYGKKARNKDVNGKSICYCGNRPCTGQSNPLLIPKRGVNKDEPPGYAGKKPSKPVTGPTSPIKITVSDENTRKTKCSPICNKFNTPVLAGAKYICCKKNQVAAVGYADAMASVYANPAYYNRITYG